MSPAEPDNLTVGLLTNGTGGPATLPVMASVSEAPIHQRGSAFLCTIKNDRAPGRIHVEVTLSTQMDGIIPSGERIDRLLPVDLSNLPVPVVCAFAKGPKDAVAMVSDDAQGARKAVE